METVRQFLEKKIPGSWILFCGCSLTTKQNGFIGKNWRKRTDRNREFCLKLTSLLKKMHIYLLFLKKGIGDRPQGYAAAGVSGQETVPEGSSRGEMCIW